MCPREGGILKGNSVLLIRDYRWQDHRGAGSRRSCSQNHYWWSHDTMCVGRSVYCAGEKKIIIYYLVLFLPLSAGVKVHRFAQRATYIINELHRPARQVHRCKRQSIRPCSHVAGVNTEEDTLRGKSTFCSFGVSVMQSYLI